MGTPATADAVFRAFQRDVAALATIEDNAEIALQAAKGAVRRAEEALNHVPSSQAAQTRLADCQQRLSVVRASIWAAGTACQKAGMGLALIGDEDSPLQLETPQHEMILHCWRGLFTVAEIGVGLQQPMGGLDRPDGIPFLHESSDPSSSSSDPSSSSSDLSEDLR